MRIRRSLLVSVPAIALLSAGLSNPSSAASEPQVGARAQGSGGGETAGTSTRFVRWIGAGGGFDPLSTQVSLEQDLVLARNTFGPDGLVFFAGGADAFGVQVLNPKAPPKSLVQSLGDLLDPREGRNARFRRPRLKPDGPATAENILAALQGALENGEAPLLLYVAAHGEMGQSPRDNSALLWSGTELKVSDLANALDEGAKRRRVRVVVTSCYSGGFADIVFAGADSTRGAADGDRCGFFASEWDQVSSGCDPDPDRRIQQGYGMHFLQALRGRSRGGQPLGEEAVDFDHDGRISLLEAHTRARITSASIDVPTTTSERWLRQVAPKEGASEKVSLPEEDIVIAALGKTLGVRNEKTARSRQEALTAHMQELKRELEEAEDEESLLYEKLRVALLERWPALDDPWHPLFQRHVRRDRESIESFLETAPEVALHRQARQTLDESGIRYDQARFNAAILQRLIRAYENRTLAARLRASGGPDWEHYQRLLACERSVP